MLTTISTLKWSLQVKELSSSLKQDAILFFFLNLFFSLPNIK